MVDQVLVILSECVLIFSELEQLLDPFNKNEPWQAVGSIKWMLKEEEISSVLTRLQASKLSAAVTQLIESNERIFRRLTDSESHSALFRSSIVRSKSIASDSESVRTVRAIRDDDDRIIPVEDEISVEAEDTQSNGHYQFGSSRQDLDTVATAATTFGHAFENDLRNSRPYLRALKRRSDWTATSSLAPSMGWSIFSGISLAEVSCLSVLNLPIAGQDLWNGGRYLVNNFEDIDRHEWVSLSHGNLSDRAIHNIARNQATSVSTITAIIDYKKSLGKTIEFGVDRENAGNTTTNVVSFDRQPSEKPVKVVILGTSLSGKTTLIQHLQSLYGPGHKIKHRLRAQEHVLQDLQSVFESACNKAGLSPDDYLSVRHMAKAYGGARFSECCRAIKALWAMPEICDIILAGEEAALNDYISYFISHLDHLIDYNYMHWYSDFLLMSREPYAPANQMQLDIAGVQCVIFDDIGRRLEPEEWISRFQELDAIIFMVSLPSYCQCAIGNPLLNAMKESLNLLRSLKKLGGFKPAKLCILLNKIDVFKQMLPRIPISQFFPDYTGGIDLFDACKFFADKFYDIGLSVGCDVHVFPISAVHGDSVCDISIYISDSLKPYDSSDGEATSWPWAKMDPDFSREHRNYMQAVVPSPTSKSRGLSRILT
ncbi:hypothetical protein ACLMJK_004353 [Lecanora helva]